METSGKEMCHVVFHYIIVVLGKYLQMMTAYYISKKDSKRVTREFEKFNETYEKLVAYFEAITNETFDPDSDEVGGAKMQQPQPDESSLDPAVFALLVNLQLLSLRDNFENQGITIEDVQEMDLEDLKDIGVSVYRHRKAILKACKEMTSTEETKVTRNKSRLCKGFF